MKIVGLTGGIGSGKSTVAKMFAQLGVPVYDSDLEAKKLMMNSKAIRKSIIALLGEQAYQNGELHRKYIAGKVFENEQLLQSLNKIVHPAVKEHFTNWAIEQKFPYVIQESALIFENGNEAMYDALILVTAPAEVRVQRVVKRDGSNPEDVIKRMEHQMEDASKKEKAHFVIENTNLEITQKRVLEIHQKLLRPDT